MVSEKISLRTRVLNAGAWSLAGFALSTIVRFGSNLLMTRLLAPEMFGVLAIASTVMVGLAMFSDLGVKQSIVQSKRGREAAFLNTAWSIQILRGILLWLVGLGVSLDPLAGRLEAIPLGSVYAAPSLPYVIGVLSLSAAIGGFDSTKMIEASRGLFVSRIIKIEISSQICGLAAMIAWVSVDRSIWALVMGSLCSTLARVVLGHSLLPELEIAGTGTRSLSGKSYILASGFWSLQFLDFWSTVETACCSGDWSTRRP